MTKTDTAAAPMPRGRSVSRGELHRRLGRQAEARKIVADCEAAVRKLKMQGETAAALASQLSGLRATAAANLAAHALKGEAGAPKLADGREDVIEKLAQAQALAEAAGPAQELVQVEIAKASADLGAAMVAVEAMVIPVLEEETGDLSRQIQALNAKLFPLHARLAGIRTWALSNSYAKEGDARLPFLRLTGAATDAMNAGGIPPNTSPQGTDNSVWADLASRLLTDADAQVAPYAEAA